MKKLNLPNPADLLERVIDLAQEYPGAFYWKINPSKPCYYSDGEVKKGPPDKCGCLIGQALDSISPGLAAKIDDKYPDGEYISEIYYEEIYYENYSALQGRDDDLSALDDIQHYQDSGLSWFQCVGKVI